MANNSKIAAKRAVPGGVKTDASFTKRSKGTTQKMDAGRKGPREEYGPRTSSNTGKVGEWTTPSVSDDKAGTRERANLPPETVAMKAPEATLPKEALNVAAPILPVPGASDQLFTVCPWDYDRDRKLGKQGT